MEKKYYEVVNVEDELPEKDTRHGIIIEGSDCIDSAVYTRYETWSNLGKAAVTHWLKPLPNSILLSVERYEALMKCVEALDEMVRCHAVFKDDLLSADVTLKEHLDATNSAKQSLQTLKKTNNE